MKAGKELHALHIPDTTLGIIGRRNRRGKAELLLAVYEYVVDGKHIDCVDSELALAIEADCDKRNRDLSAVRAEAGRKGAIVSHSANLANLAKSPLPNLPLEEEEEEEKEKEKKTDDTDEPDEDGNHFGLRVISPSDFGTLRAAGTDPVEVALKVCGVGDNGNRRCFGAFLRDLGRDRFLSVVERFKAELDAGETVRNNAAALTKRLTDARGANRGIDAPRASQTAKPAITTGNPVARASAQRETPPERHWAHDIVIATIQNNPEADWNDIQTTSWKWAGEHADGRNLTQKELAELSEEWEKFERARSTE